MPKLSHNAGGSAQATVVNLRCPACRRLGTFNGWQNIHDLITQISVQGQGGQRQLAPCRSGVRICPNPDCHEIVFVTLDNDGNLLTYPPERIDFEPTDIPQKILASFEEAITAHA